MYLHPMGRSPLLPQMQMHSCICACQVGQSPAPFMSQPLITRSVSQTQTTDYEVTKSISQSVSQSSPPSVSHGQSRHAQSNAFMVPCSLAQGSPYVTHWQSSMTRNTHAPVPCKEQQHGCQQDSTMHTRCPSVNRTSSHTAAAAHHANLHSTPSTSHLRHPCPLWCPF